MPNLSDLYRNRSEESYAAAVKLHENLTRSKPSGFYQAPEFEKALDNLTADEVATAFEALVEPPDVALETPHMLCTQRAFFVQHFRERPNLLAKVNKGTLALSVNTIFENTENVTAAQSTLAQSALNALVLSFSQIPEKVDIVSDEALRVISSNIHRGWSKVVSDWDIVDYSRQVVDFAAVAVLRPTLHETLKDLLDWRVPEISNRSKSQFLRDAAPEVIFELRRLEKILSGYPPMEASREVVIRNYIEVEEVPQKQRERSRYIINEPRY